MHLKINNKHHYLSISYQYEHLSNLFHVLRSPQQVFFFFALFLFFKTIILSAIARSAPCPIMTWNYFYVTLLIEEWHIRKTCPCNVYPFEPHFYIVKLGYTGVYLFFLFLLQNKDCGYSLKPPRQGGSNVYPETMF